VVGVQTKSTYRVIQSGRPELFDSLDVHQKPDFDGVDVRQGGAGFRALVSETVFLISVPHSEKPALSAPWGDGREGAYLQDSRGMASQGMDLRQTAARTERAAHEEE
jgi:hypothetical protein